MPVGTSIRARITPPTMLRGPSCSTRASSLRQRSGTYFSHKELPRQARDAGVLDDVEKDILEYLESQRVVADYFTEDVTLAIAQDCVASAEKVVTRLKEEDDQ